MRRILLLITDLEIGGTPTVVRELAVRLRCPPDVEVEVACLSKWGPMGTRLADAGVKVTALGADSASSLIPVTNRLVRLVNTQHFETVLSFLVHANTVAAMAWTFCHHARFFQSIQTTQPRPRWHWRVQGVAQHAAKRVIVPTESAARAAREWSHVPAEKLVVIPNAIDPDEFPRSTIATNPPHPPEPYPIGFVGRLDEVKRVPQLVRQLSVLHQTFPGTPVHLHIFGEGEQREHIEEEIHRLHLSSHVTMHGRIDRPQEALRQIGLLVLPSLAEGFGLVLIEAMAAGVPVVATDVAGIRDVVEHERTGLLVPRAAGIELAFAIMRVIEDIPLRRRLVENGLREARQRFSWESVIGAYRNVLGIAGQPREGETSI
jgi:glycosyltransferase involved in cell wall biosynthesis